MPDDILLDIELNSELVDACCWVELEDMFASRLLDVNCDEIDNALVKFTTTLLVNCCCTGLEERVMDEAVKVELRIETVDIFLPELDKRLLLDKLRP